MKENFNLPRPLNHEKAVASAGYSFFLSIEALQNRLQLLLEKKFGIKIDIVNPFQRVYPIKDRNPYLNGYEFSFSTGQDCFSHNKFYCYVFVDGRIYYSVHHHEGWSGANMLTMQSLNLEECPRKNDNEETFRQSGEVQRFHQQHLTTVKNLDKDLPEIAECMAMDIKAVEKRRREKGMI